jgi:hypothetical protein
VPNPDNYWSTAAEIDHIKNLGTFSEYWKKRPRLLLLERYQYAMSLKAEWGTIDREQARRAVETEIRACKREEQKRKEQGG